MNKSFISILFLCALLSAGCKPEKHPEITGEQVERDLLNRLVNVGPGTSDWPSVLTKDGADSIKILESVYDGDEATILVGGFVSARQDDIVGKAVVEYKWQSGKWLIDKVGAAE